MSETTRRCKMMDCRGTVWLEWTKEISCDEWVNSLLLTRILPVVVWPEMSSPAQSLASVTKLPSIRFLGLGWPGGWPCCCARSFSFSCCFWYSDASRLRQQRKEKARHISTMKIPARKVKILDSKKHHHFRSLRHSSSVCGVESSDIVTTS